MPFRSSSHSKSDQVERDILGIAFETLISGIREEDAKNDEFRKGLAPEIAAACLAVLFANSRVFIGPFCAPGTSDFRIKLRKPDLFGYFSQDARA